MKYTKNFLRKIESIYEDIDYNIVYGKGNFRSSYCVVEHENKVVVNAYFGLQGKIESLMEIILELEMDHDKLSPSSKQTLKRIHQHFKNTDEHGS